ncbi:MAG: GntR family transcriptional regulator [Spirochaetes bacterium]|nr:GntR family transcriptional regulator [Spirochaetota bacterium]MBU1081696.1 GntR family transcriptional regulator [Spirochaetota bacterium]
MRFNNDRPIFAQIAELLAEDVLSGRLAPGSRLPSARELAVSLEVNPNTAARSLQSLADSGIARCERGTGYFVAEPGPELARAERRRRFFDEELPRLWKTMDELGLGLEELERRWAERASAKE